VLTIFTRVNIIQRFSMTPSFNTLTVFCKVCTTHLCTDSYDVVNQASGLDSLWWMNELIALLSNGRPASTRLATAPDTFPGVQKNCSPVSTHTRTFFGALPVPLRPNSFCAELSLMAVFYTVSIWDTAHDRLDDIRAVSKPRALPTSRWNCVICGID